jgi:hypothetical protein
MIPTVLAGDLGWHPVNTNPADQLPAFTDGIGDTGSGLTGLLNDFPAAGEPAKLIRYDLGDPHDVSEIRLFTGNFGMDGRIFSTTAIYTSTDGSDFELLGYFQSDPSGSENHSGIPGGPDGATVVRVFRDDDSPLATDITHIRFDFYAVSDLSGVMRDPFDGVNSFTGINDGLAAAYVSPLVREIDVFGTLSVSLPGDYDGNGVVDAADYQEWKDSFGLTGDRPADGNGDGIVDAADYTVWRDHLTNSGSASLHATVPEPASGLMFVACVCLAILTGPRGGGHRRIGRGR